LSSVHCLTLDARGGHTLLAGPYTVIPIALVYGPANKGSGAEQINNRCFSTL